jgi:hypothetical protein
MKTVWKFPLVIADEQTIATPIGSKPIYINLDPNGIPCVWCDVDSDNLFDGKVKILIRGTGHPSPENVTYLGSFIQGPFVWHVYYRI